MQPVRILVWDENPPHAPKDLYPNNLRGAIADGLQSAEPEQFVVQTAHLDMPEQGCPDALLYETDVLLWWAHIRHHEVSEDIAKRIHYHVHERGMGFIPLHSAHYAKPLQWVLSTSGHLKGGWREATPPDSEEIRVCAPKHPIAEGVSDFVLEQEEMYGAPFEVPPLSCLVLQSYFPMGGEYFPSGACWTVGRGKTEGFTSGPGEGIGEGEGAGRVFYFRPGHEVFPTYYHPMVQRVLRNAALWCARRTG